MRICFVTGITHAACCGSSDHNLFTALDMGEVEFPKDFTEEPSGETPQQMHESLHNRIQQLGVSEKIKLASLGNKEARRLLIKDPVRAVAEAVINNPKLTEDEAIQYAGNKNLSSDVPRLIAGKKEFLKSYQVKVALVGNPKTPVPASLKLLPLLRDKDLKNCARSRNVHRVVAETAHKLLTKRGKH